MDVIVTTEDLNTHYKIIGPVFSHTRITESGFRMNPINDSKFEDAARAAVEDLRRKASGMGANAVIGMRQSIAYDPCTDQRAKDWGQDGSCFRIHTYGTAVRLVEDKSESDAPDLKRERDEQVETEVDERGRDMGRQEVARKYRDSPSGPYRVIVDPYTTTNTIDLAKLVSAITPCDMDDAWKALGNDPCIVVDWTTLEVAEMVGNLVDETGAKWKLQRHKP